MLNRLCQEVLLKDSEFDFSLIFLMPRMFSQKRNLSSSTGA